MDQDQNSIFHDNDSTSIQKVFPNNQTTDKDVDFGLDIKGEADQVHLHQHDPSQIQDVKTNKVASELGPVNDSLS